MSLCVVWDVVCLSILVVYQPSLYGDPKDGHARGLDWPGDGEAGG